jgi:hypothetical protein
MILHQSVHPSARFVRRYRCGAEEDAVRESSFCAKNHQYVYGAAARIGV